MSLAAATEPKLFFFPHMFHIFRFGWTNLQVETHKKLRIQPVSNGSSAQVGTGMKRRSGGAK